MIGVFFIFGVECSLYKLMIGVFVTFLWGNFHETDEVLEKNVGNFHSSPNEDTNMKTLESQPKGWSWPIFSIIHTYIMYLKTCKPPKYFKKQRSLTWVSDEFVVPLFVSKKNTQLWGVKKSRLFFGRHFLVIDKTDHGSDSLVVLWKKSYWIAAGTGTWIRFVDSHGFEMRNAISWGRVLNPKCRKK